MYVVSSMAWRAIVIVYALVLAGCLSETTPEQKDWEAVKSSENAYSLRAYLAKYPQGKFKSEAALRLEQMLRRSLEADLANFAKSLVSADPLDEYANAYPQKAISSGLREKQEEAYWHRAQILDAGGGSQPHHVTYLRRYSSGRWRAQAIERVGWPLLKAADAKDKPTLKDYEQIVELLPADNYYSRQAKVRIEEMASWSDAVKADSYDAVLAHLTKWPSGIYRDRALAMLKYMGDWRPLPMPEKLARLQAFAERQIEVHGLSIVPSDTITPENVDSTYLPQPLNKETAARCAARSDFAEIIDGFGYLARHYETHRRFLHFGNQALNDERVKSSVTAMVKTLDTDAVVQFVRQAWQSLRLTDKQRASLRAFARVASAYHDLFVRSFDKVAADAAQASWSAFQGGELWHKLGFPVSRDECMNIPFFLIDEYTQGKFTARPIGLSAETTLYDFWYLRRLEGTDKNVLAAFRAIASESK